ncbi:Cna B-type domain-containing protein [Alloscardovia macacae]|uniref:Cna protein B-type domain-containing protein n=1 Tax=Alloscardovia macacae TaxID=1160091 RepID=A0A261F3H6_9BIFI|nr:Cna B-type domain-containing protein [Alloscardovia macacae]OZG53623.1 Cna protein B-type domain-containing protein [Alloscardovia macacae]
MSRAAKKLYSVMLITVLVAVLMPVSGLVSGPAFAADTPTYTPDVTVHSYAELKDALADASRSEVVIGLAAGDYEATEKLSITGKKVTLAAVGGEARLYKTAAYKSTMLDVAADASLTVTDGVTFDGANVPNDSSERNEGGFIFTRGPLTLDGGTFKNDARSRGLFNAPIYATGTSAVVTMNGGTIRDNDYGDLSAAYGAGGIYLGDGAQMTMNGGVITGNQASNQKSFGISRVISDSWGAGGINVSPGATFTMNGGEISGNKGGAGGILAGFADAYSTNRQATNVAQFKTQKIATVTLNGGKISANGGFYGGGLAAHTAAKIDIPATSTVEVTGNAAIQGGGMLLSDWAVSGDDIAQPKNYAVLMDEWSKYFPVTLNMQGGKITNNRSRISGGGLFVSTNGAYVTGGVIDGNSAAKQGGGVYVSTYPYTLHLENAYIEGNKATRNFRNETSETGINMYSRSGGGIWFCPTGSGVFYADHGAFIGDNNDASYEGSGLVSTRKNTGSDYSVTLTNRANTGAYMEYVTDTRAVRTGSAQAEPVEIKNINTDLAVKTQLDSGFDKDLVRANSSLMITNNTASFGGGVGTNGNVVFGRPNSPLIDISMDKTWSGNVTDADKHDVEVELRAKATVGGEEKDWLIQRVKLTKENNFHYDVTDLQAELFGHKTTDILYVKELNHDGYDVTISPLAEKQVTPDQPSPQPVQPTERKLSFELLRAEDGDKFADKDRDFRVNYDLYDYTTSNLLTEETMHYDSYLKRWVKSYNPLKFSDIALKTKNVQAVYTEDTEAGNPYRDTYNLFLYEDTASDTTYILIPQVLAGAADTDQPIQIRNITVTGGEDPEPQPDPTPAKKYYTLTIDNKKKDLVSIPVTKVWNDRENAANSRPDHIHVRVLNGTATVAEADITPDDSGVWKHTFEGLPKHDEAGNEIAYTVSEDAVSGYGAPQYSGNVTDGFTITNPKQFLDIPVTKVWDDRNDVAKKRPQSVTIHLLANGEAVQSTTLNAENSWKHTFENLPVADAQGEKITYTVSEDAVPGYGTPQYSGNATDGFTITNPKSFIDIPVKKVWLDAKGEPDTQKTTPVTVELVKNDTPTGQTVKLNAQNKFSGKFENIELETDATYNVHEVGEQDSKATFDGTDYAVRVYGSQVEGFTVYNMPLETDEPRTPDVPTAERVNIPVTKVWDDRNDVAKQRPQSITVTLLANRSPVQSATLTAQDSWKHTFEKLPVVGAQGQKITYTVSEEAVPGYNAPEYSGNEKDGFTITNPKSFLDIPVKKVWLTAKGEPDTQKTTPVTVELLKNGTSTGRSLELNSANNFTSRFENIDLETNATYTVHEVGEADSKATFDGTDYAVKVDGSQVEGFTVYNMPLETDEPRTPEEPTVEKTKVTVRKVWKGDEKSLNTRPQDITVTLLASGKPVQRVTLTEQNGWRHVFEKLPVINENGDKIEYSVSEDAVSGYTSHIEQDAQNAYAFVITNTKVVPTVPNTPGEPAKPGLAKTGSAILPALIAALAAAAAGVALRLRRRS